MSQDDDAALVHSKELLDELTRKTLLAPTLSAMPPRLSPELIAQLTALASRLTQMGEYDAVDLIDTVVARVTEMPPRELLADALEALQLIANATDPKFLAGHDIHLLHANEKAFGDCINIARAAADKIRAALEHKQKEDAK